MAKRSTGLVKKTKLFAKKTKKRLEAKHEMLEKKANKKRKK
jgi:hypothetical protein